MIWRRTKPSVAEAETPKGFDDFELRLGDLMRGERATLGKSLLDVQRELKIKATYIAAIENCDISAFESPGFVAGYVRSYARYLGMDADAAFHQFCAEADFEIAHGMSSAAAAPANKTRPPLGAEVRDPFADPNASFVPRSESWLSRVEPAAVGSVLVLLGLIGGLGYGGWTVLQEVQRVQIAPVEQPPVVVADIDPVGGISLTAPDANVADGRVTRLDRPDPLAEPIVVPRDGPIAAIDPGRMAGAATPAEGESAVDQALAEAMGPEAPQVVEKPKVVTIVAARPSWVEVKAPDGTILFSETLDAGQSYVVPQLEEAALLKAGNSGATYFMIGDTTYGPVATDGRVAKNVPLSVDAVTETYAAVDLSSDAELQKAVQAVADASDVIAPDAPAE
ncbi:helix-turn-helix domain-containing protein [Neogemmobacter tilapiae]|uniref:4-hydroxy-3-methylbut-2-en-1-yl diphosphate synthase n=1 Tax=Neogemmobacter tilapiae TaxID=875041 RepID=A0A918TEP5_9RHOB|nr:helix-turn-helix domain-containing protein [Gemmobacter tilapiae]GHC44826.1 4-hydroxy-3-methylbut-2-en-1-yl diphosphate synthase [Gemmobacter tilapiae]